MTGLTKNQIRAVVPEYYRDIALRFHRMDYAVVYQPPERDHPRAVLRATSMGGGVRIWISVNWEPGANMHLELQASLKLSGLQCKYFSLPTIDDLWELVEADGRCRCGRRLLAERQAQEALERSLKRRVMGGDVRRKEIRMYPCPQWDALFHLSTYGTWTDPDMEMEQK